MRRMRICSFGPNNNKLIWGIFTLSTFSGACRAEQPNTHTLCVAHIKLFLTSHQYVLSSFGYMCYLSGALESFDLYTFYRNAQFTCTGVVSAMILTFSSVCVWDENNVVFSNKSWLLRKHSSSPCLCADKRVQCWDCRCDDMNFWRQLALYWLNVTRHRGHLDKQLYGFSFRQHSFL